MEPRRQVVETSKKEQTLSKDEDYKLWVLLNSDNKLRAKELSRFRISPMEAMVLSSIANITSVATLGDIFEEYSESLIVSLDW